MRVMGIVKQLKHLVIRMRVMGIVKQSKQQYQLYIAIIKIM